MKNLLMGIVLGAIFAWVGGRDYLDEKAQEKLYCENIKKEVWYDSPERVRAICGNAVSNSQRIQPFTQQWSGKKTEVFVM